MSIFYIGIGIILLLSALGSLYRLIKGPSSLDRVLALDFLSVVGVGAMALLYAIEGDSILLDIGIGLSLVGFFTALILGNFFREIEK